MADTKSVLLLDVAVAIHPDCTIVGPETKQGRQRYRILGSEMRSVARALEHSAVARGYAVRETGSARVYVRGNATLTATLVDDQRLVVDIDDEDSLPGARCTDEGIAIGRIAVPVGGAIVPLRERHDEGTNRWEARWRFADRRAADLAVEIERGLVRLGLRSYGVIRVPDARYCTLEVSSPQTLVRAYVREDDQGVLLNIVLVDG